MKAVDFKSITEMIGERVSSQCDESQYDEKVKIEGNLPI
jgi:hypothetical protein